MLKVSTLVCKTIYFQLCITSRETWLIHTMLCFEKPITPVNYISSLCKDVVPCVTMPLSSTRKKLSHCKQQYSWLQILWVLDLLTGLIQEFLSTIKYNMFWSSMVICINLQTQVGYKCKEHYNSLVGHKCIKYHISLSILPLKFSIVSTN